LLAGREFTARDRFGSPRVAIVNDAFARYYFRDADPIGRRFAFGREKETLEIVGVVRGSKYSRIDEPAHRVVYTAVLQDANPAGLAVYVRTAAAPQSLFNTVRREVGQLDPSLPIANLRTMTDQVADALSTQRLM